MRALISRDPRMRLEEAWREFPKLANYLRHAEPSSTERGAVTATRRLRQVYRGISHWQEMRPEVLMLSPGKDFA